MLLLLFTDGGKKMKKLSHLRHFVLFSLLFGSQSVADEKREPNRLTGEKTPYFLSPATED
ncbi:hypothetical protein GCM10007100_23000 [Roseibacillus persicicus]|uniref:Uncharacterized protein n=1 Tax=Roseibacillus persicicus TaxID=454148 RepID=A0A918WM27_9BACT|nr:hypothetical protein GCM10007100_23000 [Roseibacillus persicicus]